MKKQRHLFCASESDTGDDDLASSLALLFGTAHFTKVTKYFQERRNILDYLAQDPAQMAEISTDGFIPTHHKGMINIVRYVTRQRMKLVLTAAASAGP